MVNEAPDNLQQVLRCSETLLWWGRTDFWQPSDASATGKHWIFLSIASVASTLLFLVITLLMRTVVGTDHSMGRGISYAAAFVILAALWIVVISVRERALRGEAVLGLSTQRFASGVSERLVGVTSERVVSISHIPGDVTSYPLASMRDLNLTSNGRGILVISFLCDCDGSPARPVQDKSCGLTVEIAPPWGSERRMEMSLPDANHVYRVLQDARRSVLAREVAESS